MVKVNPRATFLRWSRYGPSENRPDAERAEATEEKAEGKEVAEMIYAKSILAGLVAVAILQMVLIAAARIYATALLGRGGYWVINLRAWLESLLMWPVLVPTLLTFGAGLWWMFRRESKRLSSGR